MRIISGDKDKILWAAMEDYSALILTICYSMTGDRFEAEDLMQEVFTAAYQHLESFDGENMKAWLAQIAANKCRDYLKSAARRIRPASHETFEMLPDLGMLPEDACLQEDAERKMSLLCGQLPEPYQTISREHFCSGKTAQEIALQLGKKLKTVQTQIYRSKGMLKKLWKGEFM